MMGLGRSELFGWPVQGRFRKVGLAHFLKCWEQEEVGDMQKSEWIWLHKIPL